MLPRPLQIALLLAAALIGSFARAAGTSAPSAESATDPADAPVSHDLRADAREAARRGVPLMLVFSAEGCLYCARLDEEVIRPMRTGGHYEEKVLVRKVMVDSLDPVVDFDGSRRDGDELAGRYRARLTPTVQLVDPQGHPLGERIRGINSVDYYWENLDAQIDAALATLRSRERVARR